MSFDESIESQIREAQARGDFDNLPGKGKPIDLSEYFDTPEDVRVAQALLKNANMVPVEIDLLREIATLKESIVSARSETEKKDLYKRIKEKQLKLNLLLESRK